MKGEKNFFICAMLVLMLFLCINASSATEPLNETLGADTSDVIAVSEAPSQNLSASGDTYVVDGIGEGGNYATISAAVSAATGGETIFIKNGEYTETSKIDIGAKQLTFTGESQDGVIIKSGDNDLFYTTTSGYSSLVISGLTFKDISMTGAKTPIFVGGDGDVTITECTFDNCASRYGAIRLFTSGSATIDNCRLLNTKSSSGSYSSAIDFGGTSASEYTLKNTIIDGSSISSASTASYIFGAIYSEKTGGIVTLDNVTIANCNLEKSSGLITAKGNMNIRKSKLVNNYVYRDLAIAGFIFVNAAKAVTVESTLIANNTQPNYILSANSASASFDLNYNNIQNNTFNTAFNNPDNGVYTLNANYWGSNDLPEGISASTWVVEDNGEFKLNTGEALEKEVPNLIEESSIPEGTIFVSPAGDDAKDGLSEENAVATIAHAIELADSSIGKIILLEGTHVIDATLFPTKDLDIAGQGVAIIDGNGKRIIQTSAGLNLTNIEVTNGYSSSSNLINIASGGTYLSLNNVKFYENVAKYGVAAQTATKLVINNSKFYDNDFTTASNSNGIIYINSADAVIENTEFRDNKAKAATAIAISRASSASTGSLKMNNVVISDNSANTGNGILAITGTNTAVEVVNSKFINNYVNMSSGGVGGNGGAIYMAATQGTLTVDQSVFINNTGNNRNSLDTGIHATKGTVEITNSILLGNATAENCVVNGDSATITAENNWWGNNDKANTDIDVTTIVTMDATMTPNPVRDGERATITATFSNDKLPDNAIDVAFTSTSGNLDAAVSVVDAKASTTYTIDANDEKITATSGSAVVEIDINRPYSGIIYVNKTGSDDNEGSINAPVATIAKAIELANMGSHEIVIDEGTYVGNGYHVTGDLTVTGKGKVTLDANNDGRLFYMSYGETADKIELSNLTLTNANGYGAAVYSFANELILDNVTIVNTQATGYLIQSNGKLTIRNSNITKSMSGNVIQQSKAGDVLINNTVFEDNSIVDDTSVYGVIYLSSGSGNLVIEDSKFINNTARQGVIKGSNNYNINVKGTEFIDNKNTVSYGGAIYATGSTLDVSDCVFINNEAYRDGGAIYAGSSTTATVDKSLFDDNKAGSGYHGDAIYNANKLTVSNSVLLNKANDYLIYNYANENVVAQNNWWGTNSTPESLVHCDKAGIEVDVSNWATMDASFTPADAQAGDEVVVTAIFSNANLPDGIDVTFTSTSGLNKVVSTLGAQASTAYTIDATDDAITATSGDAAIVMPISASDLGNIVTQDNFYSFFDDSGMLLDSVAFDELIFQGDFANLAAGYVIITKPITITGDNAVLNNMGVVVSSNDVTLNDLTFIADTALGDLVYVEGINVNLTNLNITYSVGDEAARAISIISSSDVIVNNANIDFESHVTDSGVDACAINIEESENVAFNGSEINSSLPALYVNYGAATTMFMGLDQVNPIRIMGSSKVNITKNIINSRTNAYDQDYATIQAMVIVNSHDCLVDSNNITLTDEYAQKDQDIYLYGISFAYDEGLVMSNNNFTVYTEGGKEAAGTAYAIQGIESELSIIGNNITTFSNGPNLGIYVTSMAGETSTMIIEKNTINVTGLAAEGNNWALVSGIEIQNGDAKVYNNTIYTYNVDDYNENDFLSGISYIQYMYGGRTFDIQDNYVWTEGKYAIYLLDASNSIITGNELHAHDLSGSDAVFIQSGDNNVIEDNRPTKYVTNDTFYDFFDANGALLDTITFDELIFQGEFSDLVSYITLERAITITGEDALLNDIGFIIAGNGITLDNLALIANSDLGNLIDIAGENAVISNNNITYVVTEAANAINVYPGANGAQILNNNIYFKSTVDEYAADEVTNAICVNSGVSLMDDEDPITGLVIDGNNITAVIPAFLADVYENEYYVMGISAVNGVRINGAEEFEFTNNNLNVTTNRLDRTTPTYQAIYVASSSGLIDKNNITMIDTFTPAGKDVYIDAMVLVHDEDLTISNNNFNISTTGGKNEAGSAYAVVAIASDFKMDKNNITTVSNGPNLAVYFPSRMGAPCDAVMTGNFFNVTGLASNDDKGLVSGVEVQTGSIEMSGNTIYTYNIGDYAENNYISGISYAQDGSNSEWKITDNTIYTEGHYTISIKSTDDAVITDNRLFATDLAGDDSVYIGSGDNNIVKDNVPPYKPEIIIEAEPVWIGNDANVVVTVTGASGSVTIKVNNKEYRDLVLVDGSVSQLVDAADLIAGVNEVNVTFTSADALILSGEASSTLSVLDGVITNATYANYFDANGNLASFVPDGATLDFQGLFLGKFPVYIDKSVNVISSTGDAVFDAGATFAGNAVNSFNIVAGGDYTNITGLKLINNCLYIKGASYVTVDSIKIIANKSGVGSGTGFASVHSNAYYTVVKNCYMENGGTGSSCLVLGKGGKYATFDNNIFNITGSSGNILSSNIFVGTGNNPEGVNYTNNIIYNSMPSAATMYGITVCGQGNIIENNTLVNFKGNAITNQYGATSTKNIYRNNNITGGGTMLVGTYSLVENNTVQASITVTEGCNAIDNNVKGLTISGKNAIAKNNTIEGDVTISGTNTTFANNSVSGTVTVSSNNNRIVGNDIISAGAYAIDLKTTTGNNVSNNYLIAANAKGVNAVNSAGENNNITSDNRPYQANITVVADSIWIGSNGIVTVTVTNATGSVTIKVNSKEYVVELDANGTASKEVPAEDLVVGENTVTATYDGSEFASSTKSTVLAVLDGVITNATYKYYFDANGNLLSLVPDGATLDFQGLFKGKYPVNINKPVNIITSTGDAVFDSSKTSTFNVIAGADYTNVTGLTFINTVVFVTGAPYVTLDGINATASMSGVGSGTGFVCFRGGANYGTVKNSYLHNAGNGGSSVVNAGGGAAYLTVDNNVFNITGSSGNIISGNTFTSGSTAGTPDHFTVTNNKIINTFSSNGFCRPISLMGTGNLVENNTIYQIGNSILGGSNNIYRNNIVTGTVSFSVGANSIFENNTVEGTTTIAANTNATGNTLAAVTISGANVNFIDNNVTGSVTVSSNNNNIKNNNIVSTGNYAVDLKTTTGNNVTDNYLIAKDKYGQHAVSVKDNESALIENNRPYDPEIIIDVEDITVGQDAIINITINENATGIANLIVDGKSYPVDIVNGFGNFTIPDLTANEYTVSVDFKSNSINGWGDSNSTILNVAKLESEVNVSISDAKLGNDTTITVSIPGATGNVTIIVNGKEEEIPLDENGNATYTIEDIAADDYNVVVIYPGDKQHEFAYATDSFTVPKLESEIDLTTQSEIKVGEETTITVDVTKGATGTVIINVNGTEYTFDLAKTNNLTVALDKVGEYTIVAAYSGDENYNASKSSVATIVVGEKQAANVKIEIPDDIKVGDTVIVKVTADSDAEIIVYINGEAQTFLLQSSPLGVSLMNVLKYALDKKVAYEVTKEGVYNITVVAKENEEYASQVVTKIFEATKKDALLNITPITDAKVGDKVTISVVNETDGAITIKVNGEEVTGEYEITKAGSYTINVISASTDNYNAGFATYTFEVPEEAIPPKEEVTPEISVPSDVKAGESASIDVSIANATGNVSVIVDGVESVVALDENGSASVALDNVSAGNHSIVVIYSGDETHVPTYSASSFSVPEDVTPEPEKEAVTPEITVPTDMKAGESASVDISIANATGNVSVIVDGVESVVALDENGSASVALDNVSAGNHSIVVIYSGDETHVPTYSASSFSVPEDVTPEPEKETSNVTVSVPENIKAGESASVDVSIPGASGNVSVIVDGKETIVALVNGSASVPIDDVSAGNHSVVVIYSGDETHAPTHSASSFSVPEDVTPEPEKETSNVTVSVPENIKAGESASVDVSIPGASGNVSVIVDGKETVVALDENGSASVALDDVSAGDHSVVVIYPGDETHAPTYSASSFSVPEEAVVIPIASEFGDITIDDDLSISMVLKEETGKAIANAQITYTINGVSNTTTTDANGKFTIKAQNGVEIFISYAGNGTILGTNTTLKLNSPAVPSVVKLATRFNIDSNVSVTSITINGYAVDTLAGEEGMLYTTVLVDENGKPLANVPINFAVNNKIYNRTTYENGSFDPYHLNMIRAGRYTMAFYYAGDETHNATLACVCVDLDKKPTTIKASAKTYKASAKTKKYTVTLKTIAGSSLDGKVYLKAGKTITLTIKDKVYKAKTNAKGQATFKITKLTKKGKYSATIFYKGDKTYEEATKNVKITLK